MGVFQHAQTEANFLLGGWALDVGEDKPPKAEILSDAPGRVGWRSLDALANCT
jgi:hypothetical protein